MNSRKHFEDWLLTPAFLAVSFILLCASAAYAQKKAAVFVSPELSTREKLFTNSRVEKEKNILENLGYSVDEMVGSSNSILNALLSKKYRAMSYFGHGREPSMESLGAKQWKAKVFGALLKRYSERKDPNAFNKADEESQNFGLELVRNNSCFSLADNSLANQFVKPGGLYYGVKKYFSPCPTPAAVFWNVNWNLTEYRVPSTTPKTPPKKPNSDSGLLVKIVMTCGSAGDNGQYAYPASGVKVNVGGQNLVTKGGTARNTTPLSFGSVTISVPGENIVSVVVTDNNAGKTYKIKSPKSTFTVNLPPVQRGGSASHYAVAIRLVSCH